MVKKVLALVALVLCTSVGTAQAQNYPPGGNLITADDASVAPGSVMQLRMQLCQPGSTATFQLDGAALATTTADSSGVASTGAKIPSTTRPGAHTIQGACTGSDGQPLTLVLGITITGAGTGLPVTGSANTTPMTQIAVGAIAGGGLLVLLANRRRNAKAATRENASV